MPRLHMLSAVSLLIGGLLVLMALVEQPVRRLPLSTAVIYLGAGWAAATFGLPHTLTDPRSVAAPLTLLTEWVVLLSLFAIGLRLRTLSTWRAWRVAGWLATTGMLLTVLLATVAAHVLLGLAWPAALLLGALLAPTDPVLASEVQVVSEHDRDAVRLALTAEGALNDGTAFPVVMLALGTLGLNELGPFGTRWLLQDLLWPVAGALAAGWLLGHGIGRLVRLQLRRGHPVAWDELLFLGAIALGYGLAELLHLTAFLLVFASGIALFHESTLRGPATSPGGADSTDLAQRMAAFGSRCERVVEVLMVVFIGAAMTHVQWRASHVAFALALLLLVRPVAVLSVVRRSAMPVSQRRLVGWFGIRGVGSLFYLAFALQQGIAAPLAAELVSVCVLCIALSIVLHGVSATPVMKRYRPRARG